MLVLFFFHVFIYSQTILLKYSIEKNFVSIIGIVNLTPKPMNKIIKLLMWEGFLNMLNKILTFGAVILLALISGFLFPTWTDNFHIDPLSVQKLNSAYRYPQAGWVVIHIEGKPYDRGIQHGKLLAPEIANYIQALAAVYQPKSPTRGWKIIRKLTNVIFLNGFSQEQLQEMQGIADGAKSMGATFDNRSIDLIDIIALNASNELDSLQSALEANPSELKSLYLDINSLFPFISSKSLQLQDPPKKRQHCSAFAATGPATKDGKIVFGHITMFDLYPANFYNIWLDIKPTKGHHFVMQTFPGGIHSGMDYSISDAGILLSETTLDQSDFKSNGIPLAARIREATQYAESIEQAAKILSKNGNGLSTTEWILADINRNEIGLLTLGTHEQKLYRSSHNEWISGAKGFYWSNNNTKDRAVRLETIPSLQGRPSANAVFVPSKRDTVWLQLYDQYKGKIDVDFAQLALTKPELASAYGVDAKYTTTDLAKKFQSWGTFGPPVAGIWRPTITEKQNFPHIKPLVSNPWVLLSTSKTVKSKDSSVVTVDLFDPEDKKTIFKKQEQEEETTEDVPAWYGTLLPKTDADIWLVTAFANYERIVKKENSLRRGSKNQTLTSDQLDDLAVEIFYHRSIYELGRRAGEEVTLAQTKINMRDENWYRVASGKGVLLLHSLRGVIGAKNFDRLMNEFGLNHAGKEVSTVQFQIYLEKETGKNLQPFFDQWLHQTGLPELQLGKTEVKNIGNQWVTTVSIERTNHSGSLVVPITLETSESEITQFVSLEQPQKSLKFRSNHQPKRVILDKYGLTAHSNGSPFTILTFDTELDKTLIVYGTLDEAVANQEAAQVLQYSLTRREHNIKVVIKMDSEVTNYDLKNHHLLLIGRPNTNSIVKQFQKFLPVTFGTQSFEIRRRAYAHPESAVAMAIENPLNQRYSMVTISGLSALSTLNMVSQFEGESISYAPIVLFPYNQEEQDFVSAPEDFIQQLN